MWAMLSPAADRPQHRQSRVPRLVQPGDIIDTMISAPRLSGTDRAHQRAMALISRWPLFSPILFLTGAGLFWNRTLVNEFLAGSLSPGDQR